MRRRSSYFSNCVPLMYLQEASVSNDLFESQKNLKLKDIDETEEDVASEEQSLLLDELPASMFNPSGISNKELRALVGSYRKKCYYNQLNGEEDTTPRQSVAYFYQNNEIKPHDMLSKQKSTKVSECP